MMIFITGICFLIIGALVTFLIMRKRVNRIEKQECSVLLERIKPALKLVTVEGHFSEVFSLSDSKKMLGGLLNQTKKVIIIVKAKALVGLDLSKALIDVDSKNKLIKISELPKPEILSIDTDMNYYDISESIFNKFSADNYTDMNLQAKELLQQQVLKSSMPNYAEQQAIELIKILETSVKCFGWNVVLEQKKLLINTNN